MQLEKENSLILKLQPRENAYQHGINALSDRDLLQLILRTGTQQVSAEQLAAQLLTSFENLSFLAQASIEELLAFKGIGHTKAIALLAAFELGQRSLQQRQLRYGTVTSSQAIGEQMLTRLQGCQQEQLIVVYLDTKNQIIQEKLIFRGSLNSAVAHPREIFHQAVLLSAARLIVVHNHPSGQTEPSTHDLNFSKRLIECGQLMGIDCLDHLIIGHRHYLSLREAGLI